MERSPARNRILIILTDASPNDDHRIPPDRTDGRLTGRDYSGEAGIEDTAAEVRQLRKDGIRVMAVLNGEEAPQRPQGRSMEKISHGSSGLKICRML